MRQQVDIQMPVRRGGFVVGEVIRRLLLQDVTTSFYVEAGEDLHFADSTEELIQLISRDETHAELIRLRVAASRKRNRLRSCGSAPWVYLADPDVLLPPEPILGSMMDLLEADPEVRAVGLPYLPEYEGHVAAGSMLLARNTLEQVGEFRHLARFCECDYIKHQLETAGYRVASMQDVGVTHLREAYQAGYPDHATLRVALPESRRVPRELLERAMAQDGDRFKLHFETRSEP